MRTECQSVRYSRARAGPSNSSVSSVVCVPSACTPGSSERTQDNAFPVSAFNLQHNVNIQRRPRPTPESRGRMPVFDLGGPVGRAEPQPGPYQRRAGARRGTRVGRRCARRSTPTRAAPALRRGERPRPAGRRLQGGRPAPAVHDPRPSAAPTALPSGGWSNSVGRRTGSPIPGPPNVARGSGPRPHPPRGPSWRAHAPHATPPGAPAPLRGLSTLRPEVGWETAKGDVHVIETKVGCLAARRHPVCGGRALPPHPEPPPRHLPTSPVRVAGAGEKPHGRTAALPKGSRDEPVRETRGRLLAFETGQNPLSKSWGHPLSGG
ncbi:uncharacterized protein LOC144340957 [Macaca mulatta]